MSSFEPFTEDDDVRFARALAADAARHRRPVPAGLAARVHERLAAETGPQRRPRTTFGRSLRLAAAAALLALGLALWPEGSEEARPPATSDFPFAELASVEQAVGELPRRLSDNLAEPLSREADRLRSAGSSAARRFRVRGPLRVLVPFLGTR